MVVFLLFTFSEWRLLRGMTFNLFSPQIYVLLNFEGEDGDSSQ